MYVSLIHCKSLKYEGTSRPNPIMLYVAFHQIAWYSRGKGLCRQQMATDFPQCVCWYCYSVVLFSCASVLCLLCSVGRWEGSHLWSPEAESAYYTVRGRDTLYHPILPESKHLQHSQYPTQHPCGHRKQRCWAAHTTLHEKGCCLSFSSPAHTRTSFLHTPTP